ncbi:methyltransferase-like protein 24 [Mizuhopecten yessoensis]|uniref:Methyltransferase-like protein 24 n=1 Tax=Mizuhopecten yessoensis TaxID=6573 RepID=A0A210PNQ6_MIZYE|nr:methyltransferase-like protein 24 [Mizuhopecten yessoensis]OWF38076.1 Methyltransferase-like protein 24 [Mizuhopecten yessoensis]
MRARWTLLAVVGTIFMFSSIYWVNKGSLKLQLSDGAIPTTEAPKPKELTRAERLQYMNPDPNNDTLVLPPKQFMDRMIRQDVMTLYHRYINSLQFFCHRVLHLGKLDDGGWDICDDKEFRPNQHCLVYSYGINFDFSFDDAIVKQYGCEVHAYDPSMNMMDHIHGNQVFFHNVGLTSDNNSMTVKGIPWKMGTFGAHRTTNGHLERAIDILKVDIEDWEWIALPEMLRSGTLRDVQQFVIEFHLTRVKAEPSIAQYLKCLKILKDIYDEGFRIFWTHRNLWCKFYSSYGRDERCGCHEVSFVRVS